MIYMLTFVIGLSVPFFLANARDTISISLVLARGAGLFKRDPSPPRICSLENATCVLKDDEQNHTH